MTLYLDTLAHPTPHSFLPSLITGLHVQVKSLFARMHRIRSQFCVPGRTKAASLKGIVLHQMHLSVLSRWHGAMVCSNSHFTHTQLLMRALDVILASCHLESQRGKILCGQGWVGCNGVGWPPHFRVDPQARMCTKGCTTRNKW